MSLAKPSHNNWKNLPGGGATHHLTTSTSILTALNPSHMLSFTYIVESEM